MLLPAWTISMGSTMIVRLTRPVGRRLISHNPSYTKLPLQDHYIQLLVKEGLEEQQAKELVTVLDNQVRQKLFSKSLKYMSGRDYLQLMKKYEESIGAFRQSLMSTQQDIVQTLKQDYTALDQEISQTQVNALNEIKQLESGIQLDLNMEVKRRAEAKEEIDLKTDMAGGYSDEQLGSIQEDLSVVSKQARSAIITFGSVAFISLLLYHASAT